ncbi:MAG: hypothetical protein JSW59_10445, partial [Phycisphaerales bacterium]
QKLQELETKLRQLKAKMDEEIESYSKFNYGIEPEKISSHVKKSMEEFARNLRTADFELVGLNARIDLIDKYKTGGEITDQATLIKLNQMLIADEIERAGVLARRSAYEAAFRQAKELNDTITARNKASLQKSRLEVELKSAQNNSSKMERILAEPKPDMRPVEVYENKVTIHPVEH